MFEKLDMPPEVAGVTFLAFGNGAPDVFSAFVALTSNLDREEGLLVGVGSLLGSSESVDRGRWLEMSPVFPCISSCGEGSYPHSTRCSTGYTKKCACAAFFLFFILFYHMEWLT